MSRFWRDGFCRTSAYGNTHWVEGHWVERDDWSRFGSSMTYNYFDNKLTELRCGRSATSRFVNPNADCPVCGQPVFFYQNEYGSRVYFDELGPPWPKHPCTNNEIYRRTLSGAEIIIPTMRDSSQISSIQTLLLHSTYDLPALFIKRYGATEWPAWRIDGRFPNGHAVMLVLSAVNPEGPRRLFVINERLPKSLARGTLVFFKRGRLIHLDLETMQPKEFKVRRLPNATAFVEQLISVKPK